MFTFKVISYISVDPKIFLFVYFYNVIKYIQYFRHVFFTNY